MHQIQSEDQHLKTVSLLDELPNQPVLSSKPKGWNGITVEYHHHLANELISPPLAHHLITLNCGLPYGLVQRLDGQVYEGNVEKGDIILTPANQATEYFWNRKVNVLHLCLEPALIAKVAVEAIEIDAARIEVLNRFAASDLQIQQLGHLLLAELEAENLGSRLYAESLTNALAVHLIREYSTIKKQSANISGGLSRTQLQQVIAYIQEHLDQDLSLDKIAAVTNLSAYHFSRLFKQSIGLAPHQYQIRCRVERAKELLQAGEMTITDIATQVGFYDQSHLSRHFKRIVGVSPKTIQKNSKNVLWIGKSVQD